MNGSALASETAVSLAALIRSRAVSCLEVTQAVLARIEALEPTLNAVVVLDTERAIKATHEADAAVSRGEHLGMLHGVPVTIKDLVAVSGLPTRRGSQFTPTAPLAADAPAVARLRAAGAIVICKTTTTEQGWTAVSSSPLSGHTHNPWRHGFTAGGSSSGAAALAAAGCGPLHLGTDGAGSVRLPAHFCGVVGFKPTFGLVPYAPCRAPACSAGHPMSSISNTDQPPFRNELLAALPNEVTAQMRPHLHHVSLVMEQELHQVGNPLDTVYFIEAGLVSLTADTGDNGFVEVGMTGREGSVGASALLNPDAIAVHRALVQIGGTALRINASILRGLIEQHPVLRDRCLRYLQFLMVQTSQAAACNARHELPERLARWLLMTRDRVDSDELPMTQEFMSYMLGVRRAGVSVVAGALQAQGLVQPARGRMTILDRAGLEEEACVCYRLIEDSQRRIMGQHAAASGADQAD